MLLRFWLSDLERQNNEDAAYSFQLAFRPCCHNFDWEVAEYRRKNNLMKGHEPIFVLICPYRKGLCCENGVTIRFTLNMRVISKVTHTVLLLTPTAWESYKQKINSYLRRIKLPEYNHTL